MKRTPIVACRSCVSCGECAETCPRSAISMANGVCAQPDPEICTGCGFCAAVCPASAIAMSEPVKSLPQKIRARKSRRNYLWLITCLYFLLGLYNIAFAWLGLIFFCAPLVIALFKGDKTYCNKYCDRGILLRTLGNQGLSRRRPAPAWLKSFWFRHIFMLYFFGMFGSVLLSTWLVFSEARGLDGSIRLFQALRLPVEFASPEALLTPWPAWMIQFAFGFYSVMLTSMALGILAMLLFRPRSWCVFCPMGTLTQDICRIRANSL